MRMYVCLLDYKLRIDSTKQNDQHLLYPYTITSICHIMICIRITYILSCDIHEYNYLQDMYKYEEITYQFHNNSYNVSYNTCNSDY